MVPSVSPVRGNQVQGRQGTRCGTCEQFELERGTWEMTRWPDLDLIDMSEFWLLWQVREVQVVVKWGGELTVPWLMFCVRGNTSFLSFISVLQISSPTWRWCRWGASSLFVIRDLATSALPLDPLFEHPSDEGLVMRHPQVRWPRANTVCLFPARFERNGDFSKLPGAKLIRCFHYFCTQIKCLN